MSSTNLPDLYNTANSLMACECLFDFVCGFELFIIIIIIIRVERRRNEYAVTAKHLYRAGGWNNN